MQALPAMDGGFAPRDAEDGSWASSFASRVADLRSEGVTYEDSASFLRALTKSGILRFTDIRDRPDRFFLAHRLLARHAPEHGPGFWIRFTVQFNLFAGTVVALGGPEHLKQLDAIQDAGQLGCFGLTERLAGVNSGLVVNTTARWDPATETFIINSPDEGSAKNWISQGLCAEKAVCVANLTVGHRRCGPHAFLVDLRDPRDGRLAAGITVGDMGRKTTGNDLDNAWIEFRDVRVPKSALLNRYGDVDAKAGRYVPAVEGARTMDMIGQRLFTGRVAVAQAALTFTRGLFAATRAYSDGKRCTMRGDAGQFLSDVPQLNSLYANAGTQLDAMDGFVAGCEAELATCLVRRAIPPAALTRAIAVAKIRAVETSIASCHALKQEVGSYALMPARGLKTRISSSAASSRKGTAGSCRRSSRGTRSGSSSRTKEKRRGGGRGRRPGRAGGSRGPWRMRRGRGWGSRRLGTRRGWTCTRSRTPCAIGWCRRGRAGEAASGAPGCEGVHERARFVQTVVYVSQGSLLTQS